MSSNQPHDHPPSPQSRAQRAEAEGRYLIAEAQELEATAAAATSRATKYGRASFILALFAMLIGIGTGITIPITTEPGVTTGIGGYTWSHRAWTPATEIIMWSGLGTTAILVMAALWLGLVGRKIRAAALSDDDIQSVALVLSRRSDLGVVIALVTPLAIFVAETISMAFVQILS